MGKQDHLSAGKSTSKAAQTANIRKIYRRPPPLTTTKCSALFISCANILFGKLAVQPVPTICSLLHQQTCEVSPGAAKDLVAQMKDPAQVEIDARLLQHLFVQSIFAVVHQDGVVAFVHSQFTTFLHISQALCPSAELRSDLCREEWLLLIGIA